MYHLHHQGSCFLLYAGFLLGLPFDPEDGGDMFLWIVGWLSPYYMALYFGRENSSRTLLPLEMSSSAWCPWRGRLISRFVPPQGLYEEPSFLSLEYSIFPPMM
jgi:hypothetical protein